MKPQTVYIKVEKYSGHVLQLWNGNQFINQYLEEVERYVFTKEEMIEHDKKIAENAFDAGGDNAIEMEHGASEQDKYPNKTEYINTIINPKQ